MMRPNAAATLIVDSVAKTKGVACGPQCATGTVTTAGDGLGKQIADFFTGIFDTSLWPARWHCGSWTDFHGWFYILSDLLIWASYFAIPILLIRMITKRKDIPFPRIIWLFVAFIILCGTTHLVDALIFWWPVYRLSALIRFVTGVVSAFTVYVLYKVMPMVLSLRSVKELQHEINERKLVEEKLAASEFLLKEAGRLGQMGGWEYEPVSGRSMWSPTVYDIFDVSHDAEITDVFSHFEEPHRQILRDTVTRAYETGAGWDLELQLRTAKNNVIWVRSCGEYFYADENKHNKKLRGVLMDIDRYKKTELDLNRSHGLLFQSHQQLKTFTHILSHNIRNHSSNIALLTDLVEPETLDENNADLFDKLSKVSRNLNTTLNDLAQAIKIRETAIPAELLTLRDAASKAIDVLEQEIQGSGTIINFDFKVESVMFPKLYLESVLLNLVSNAIKYRKENLPAKVLLSTFKNTDGNTVLECRDNGLGINLDLHAQKIFGLYKTFHANKEAHGVGLFLIKTQIESQGGSIAVESEVNKGTTFKITFALP